MVAVEKEKGKGFTLAKDDKYHPVYVDQYGNKHDAFTEGLYDYLHAKVLGKIGDLFLLVDGAPDDEGWGFIFRLLISDAEKKLELVCDLLEKGVGEITVHSLIKGYPWNDDNLPDQRQLKLPPREK